MTLDAMLDDHNSKEDPDYWTGVKWLQYIGIKDKNKKEIYAGDILSDGQVKFRIYSTEGGFATKAWPWAKNIQDEKPGDELIFLPCAQTRSYIIQSCEIIGNIYEQQT